MKAKLLYVLILLPVSVFFAQDEQTTVKPNNLKLAFEFGANFGSYEAAKPERIRENYPQNQLYTERGYYIQNNIWLETVYLGVKPEIFLYNNRLGIASGLRFTQTGVRLRGERNGFLGGRNDILWKVAEEGLTTDFVRLMDITQKSYLLGIPLEVRFFPNNRELPFQHYFKMGFSFNYRINQNYQVGFRNETMEKYDDLIQSQMPKTDVFSTFFYGGMGFKIGKVREGRWVPWGNIEFQIPYLLLTKKSFAFVGTGVDFPGFGFQMSFQIPIGDNVPMGTKNNIVKTKKEKINANR